MALGENYSVNGAKMDDPWSPLRETQHLRNLVTVMVMMRIITDAAHGVLICAREGLRALH